MTSPDLVATLAAGDLQAAAGVLVELGPDDEVTFFTSRAWTAPPSICDPVTVDALLAAGLVARRAAQAGIPLRPHDWNAGWPGSSSDGTLLVALDEALIVPPDATDDERRLTVLRFLAAVAPQVGAALVRVLRGTSRLLSLSPAQELAEIVRTPPERRVGVAFFAAVKHGWCACDASAFTGPLSPALGITVSRNGHQCIATTPVLPSPGGIGMPLMTAAGVRSNAKEARLVAAAEAHERHVAGVMRGPDLVVGTLNELQGALDPDAFISFVPWQRETHRDLSAFDPGAPRVWVASHTVTGAPRYVLADLVFYPFGSPGSLRHVSATSSGIAAHTTPERAALAAWAELVERDAFMRHWLARTPGRSVVFPTPPDEYTRMLDDIHQAGWSTRLVQLGETPDLPVLCIVATKSEGVVLGAAAGAPEAAAVSALRETWAAVRATDPHEAPTEPHAVRTPSDHRRLYQRGGLAAEVVFLTETEEVVSMSDLRPLDRIPERCITYVWPWCVSRPFHVVRVLDADLIPITFGFEREPLGRADVRAILDAREESGRGMIPHPFG